MSDLDQKDQKDQAMATTSGISMNRDLHEGSVHKIQDVDSELDVAAAYADLLDGENSYTNKEEKRLRWKLDLRLVPILWFNVTLGAMDKVTTSTGAVYGMKTDCDLTGDRYAWVGSAFYFGYLFCCFPSGRILQRFRIAKTMASAEFFFGLILIGTGFVSSFPALMAVRILLGMLEAPIVPGNLLVISMWYTRAEQPIRAGLFYTGLSTCFSGPIGYAVGFISGKWFNPWRAFFWITGSMTIAWGIVVGIFLPDSPVRAKFITEREKAIAVDRVRADQTGIENKVWKWEQFWEAMRDPKTWLMFFFNIWISIPNGGLTNFTPLIIKGLGYSSQKAVLLSIPPGIIQTLSSYTCNGAVFLLARRLPKYHLRGVIIIIGLIIGMISTVFVYCLPLSNLNGRLVAIYFAYFYLGPYIVSLGLITANTAGHTKKITLNSLVFIAYCVSNIIGPHFFVTNQAPLYPLGMAAILGSYVLSLITIGLYMTYCWWENRRRDQVDEAAGQRVHQDTDFKDLTDQQNIHFRYMW